MKVYDNATPGILLGSELAIRTGISSIEFEPTLLTAPGATFGKHLINAIPVANHQVLDHDGFPHYTLRGTSAAELKEDNRALIRFYRGAAVDGRQTYAVHPEESDLATVLKYASLFGQRWVADTRFSNRSVYALIVLKPGGSISFREEVDYAVKRTAREFIRRCRPSVDRTNYETVVAWDGERVVVNTLAARVERLLPEQVSAAA